MRVGSVTALVGLMGLLAACGGVDDSGSATTTSFAAASTTTEGVGTSTGPTEDVYVADSGLEVRLAPGTCDPDSAVAALETVAAASRRAADDLSGWVVADGDVTIITAGDDIVLEGPDEIAADLGDVVQFQIASLEMRPGFGNPTPHLLFSGDADVAGASVFFKGAVTCSGMLWNIVMGPVES